MLESNVLIERGNRFSTSNDKQFSSRSEQSERIIRSRTQGRKIVATFLDLQLASLKNSRFPSYSLDLLASCKMVKSDHSETEEGDMDRLQLSSDSVDAVMPKKRPRVEDSEDETDLPAKKRQSSFGEWSKMSKNDNVKISDKNNIDERDIKEERHTFSGLSPKNEESDMDKKNKDGRLMQENRSKSAQDENSVTLSKRPDKIREEIVEKRDEPSQKPVANTSVLSVPEKEQVDETVGIEKYSRENEMEKERHKKHTVDTEVVDGLELSVECASDKEESSSESEDEKDAKPRPKTIIVKAEPNESELDCSSEGEEKSDSQQIGIGTLEIKSERSRAKRRGSRTSFSKVKASGSEDSQNSNSDEDYSPRTRKKMKRSTNKPRSTESKRERGRGVRRNSYKKNAEDARTMTATERANETTTKIKNGTEEELLKTESLSKSESDSNSEKDETSVKSKRRSRSNTKSEDKRINMLKTYLRVAGVKVKSFNDIWAGCTSNAAKVRCLRELLEKNGVSGRPTLEKCKRAREKNEKMREVSELDMSNIISEGRITRARRNVGNVKKLSGTSAQDARTFRRIQAVVDSDSE